VLPISVLLADDESLVRGWLSLVLRPLGCQITEAGDGAELEALLLGSQRFDLVITDIGMPRRSGLEVAASVRRAGVTTPIIFISGYADRMTLAQVADLGRAEFLPKPLDLLALFTQIHRLLSPRCAFQSVTHA